MIAQALRTAGSHATGARTFASINLFKAALRLDRKARLVMRVKSISTYCKVIAVGAMFVFSGQLSAAALGTLIENTAQATFDVGLTVGSTESSNTVGITTTILRTPSSLSLLRYEPSAAVINEEAPSQCRSGAGGGFIPSPNPTVPVISSGSTVLDPTSALPLSNATTFLSNEPIFIQLHDGDQNIDPAVIDTAMVSVSSSLGEQEDILVTETDVDTGVFIAYVQSTVGAVNQFDCLLTVGPEATVRVNYTDAADASDSSFTESLVDPFGVVFNSLTGDLIDGITIQLVNAASGLPAVPGVDVFGNDGVSSYPNTLVTGSTATDSGGAVYNFPAGGYRFPLVRPGNYRLEIVSARDYNSPSSLTIPELQLLPNAPFALLNDASFGADFVLVPGPPLHVDVPIDPISTELVVSKTTQNRDAAIGDFIRYQLSVENTEVAASIPSVSVFDTLPVGFRYQTGSARLDGLLVADPIISGNGRTLEFPVGDLVAGQIINLSYVTEVSSGTAMGDAINSATAQNPFGSTSNIAQSIVKVRDELMRERNTIVGRVIAGNCPLQEPDEGLTTLQMQSTRKGNQIDYTVNFEVKDVRLNAYQIEIKLPEGLHYIPSSSMLDEYPWHDPSFNERSLLFELDTRRFQDVTQWQHKLQFSVQLDTTEYGRKVTAAQAHMFTEQGISVSTPVASNILLRERPVYEERRFVFRPIFPTLEASLTDPDQVQLDKIVTVLRDIDVVKVNIEGHADNRPINSEQALYGNNMELSRARAKAIAPYFQTALKLSDEQVTVSAAGDQQPIASNRSESGQALNRRVDISVTAKVRTSGSGGQSAVQDSGIIKRTITPVPERDSIEVGTTLKGLAGARIYLEDGTYVVTDENGKYHFEGIRPGTHVVQLDLASLPSGVRVIDCEKNSRFSGSAYSRFVDLKPGTLWRVDFHVEEELPEVSEASIQMHTRMSEDTLHYTLENKGGAVAVANYRLTVILPQGVRYQKGSSRVHDKLIADPQLNENILVYRLGDMKTNWDMPLTFKATVPQKLQGKLVSKAAVVFNSETKRNQRIAPVETIAIKGNRDFNVKRFVLNPKFDTLGAELNVEDKRKLDTLLPELLKSEINRITVIGHTDNVPISATSKNIYENNYALSTARAKSVANYLGISLGLANQNILVKGQGADSPVASNATAEGRAQNRRTEIYIETVKFTGKNISTMLRAESEKHSAKVQAEKNVVQQKKTFTLPETTIHKIEEFDELWLEQTSPGIEWLMPVAEFIPEVRAVSVAIKHGPMDRIEGFVNGEPLNPLFYFGIKQNKQGTVARSYWQGIHIKDGSNTIKFVIYPANGDKPVSLERAVHFSSAPVRAELVEEYSYLVADGRTPPTLAVRFYDRSGQPVRAGMIGEFDVQPPYQSKQRLESMAEDKLSAFDQDQPTYQITERGIAFIELEPTTQSGKVALDIKLNDGKQQDIEAWLKPEQRDWIVVGLGEGVVGKNDVSGDSAAAATFGFEDDNYDDSRLALFAKGGLGKDWILTTAIDSDKEESATGQGLFQTVDPDSYFALYGDDTEQRYEAASSDKLFLRLENENFYTMYGDFDTGLNSTELSKYNRRVTGLKSEFNSELFGLNIFAAETDSRFVRDEIQGDGTSGLYQLRGADILINSESIIIETRDRFRSQDILEQRTLRRHYDYNIDYISGTILFKRAIPSRDQNFNPIFIVAEYETATGLTEELAAGGRGEFRFLNGDIKLGVSAISDDTFADAGELFGLDAEVRLSSNSRLQLEFASSETDDAGTLLNGDAYLAEYKVEHEKVDGRIYLRQQDAGFGMGQQAGSETATRKYGVDGSVNLTEAWRLNAEVFHEDNLVTNAKRDIAEADISYSNGQSTLMTGLRSAKDVLGTGQENKSELLLAGVTTRLLESKLQLKANAEYAIDSIDANSAYPTRYMAGAEYSLSPTVSAYLEQEITEGERQDTSSTRVGISAQPWAQANIDTSVEQQLSSEYGPRTFALMGLTQGFRINEQWSADLSYDRAETIRTPGDTPFNTNVPPQSGTASEDFSAISTGLSWRGDMSTVVTRFEYRDAEMEDRYGLLVGWHRELSEGISYGIDSQMFMSEYADGGEAIDKNVRLSFAYRPTTSKWIHLNRFDYRNDERKDGSGNDTRQRKLINNWKANYMPNRRNQFAVSYGVKYVIDTYDETEYKGLTHSIGAEYRFDLTSRWDIGAHADMLYSVNANNRLYSYGLSTGYNLVKNLWLSIGYNLSGYEDDDFTGAEYTAEGPYLKLRFKFDQNSFAAGK